MFYLRNFITDAEADEIMNLAKPLMTRSTVAGQDGENKESDVRTSSYAWLSTKRFPSIN